MSRISVETPHPEFECNKILQQSEFDVAYHRQIRE